MHHTLTRAGTALLLTASLAGSACGDADPAAPGGRPGSGGPERPVLPETYRPSGHAAAGGVFVHLFEWPWRDVAAECETVLGPAGYAAVQVSPPQEHIVLPEQDYPWWQRYQPVSYSLERSRSGTRAEFVEMVDRCGAAGVDIYVDAVINHMTAGAGTGSAGTPYTKYDYPGLYSAEDFHPRCDVTDYQDEANVQDCELLGLADLATGRPDVRDAIAGYLAGLTRLGVAGFRIDAAKHIQPVELDGILDRVNERVAGEGLDRPYWFAEVIDHGGEAVEARDYYGLAYGSGGAADLTEFRYRGVGDKFLGAGGQTLAELETLSPAGWRLMPTDKAVVFLQNHDTQRDGGLTYRDAAAYRLAHVWLLGHPYGHPKVLSGYAFPAGPAGRDAGPPSDGGGWTEPVACAATLEAAAPGSWACSHRDPWIAAMVGFRRAVAGAPLEGWWDNGANAIAFSRGDRGFLAINAEAEPAVVAAATRMPAGTYCDILSGGRGNGGCAGQVVVVDGEGGIELELGSDEAVAIHVEE